MKRTCYVIGNPIKQSLSPLIHNAAYKKLELEDQYQFSALELQEYELKKFIESIKAGKIAGISVTLPFKNKVIEFLDELSPEASAIQAVNTIIFKDNKIIGFNTDCYGIEKSIKEALFLPIEKALVVGAGGAARSAIVALQKLNCEIFILNRNMDHAESLATEFDVSFLEQNQAKNYKFDILINTTPVGMYPNINGMSVNFEIIKNTNCIFDTVYNPKETELIKTATRLGKMVIHGVNMFIHQAEKQFELYTGSIAPLDVMRSELESYFKYE